MNKNQSGVGLVVGVDVGGTNIRAGLVNHFGELVGKSFSIPTNGNDRTDAVFARIKESISNILEVSRMYSKDVRGIGMGVTGPLDNRKGLILECPQLPTLHNFPLRQKIRDAFHLPVQMNNDANAMILGESIWGSGKGHPLVLGFTLGTGLGCAFVTDQRLHPGRFELSGEIWPSPYKDVTIEDYVSGRGISAMYQAYTGSIKSALEIGRLADDNDSVALDVWRDFGEALGFAMAWTINLLDPDIVVLGGSISNSFHLFERSLLDFLKKYLCPSPAGMPPIVRASLGDEAGVIGGASLMFTHPVRVAP